jgi:porin
MALSGLPWMMTSAVAQHSMPVPACPARGLVAPGSDGMWYLDGCYGCQLRGDAEGESADVPVHLIPIAFHEFGGIAAEYIYTGEVFSLAHGGFNSKHGTKYRGNLDLVLTADTEALDLWEGGRFFVYGNSFHGRTLTANHVGDTQFYSNIDSSPRAADEFQVTEYWYEHSLANGDIVVKVGKQDANADFAFVDLGGDFINSSFGLVPTVPLPTWPNPGMGASAFLNLTDLLHYKIGVYDGAPTFSAPTGAGWAISTVGDFGAMTLQELSFTPQFGHNGDLPGTYRIGTWYHTHDFDNLETGVGTVSGNYGFWTSADQLLWKEPGSDDEPQGLGSFLQYGWAPSDRNGVDNYYGAGLTYRGAIPSRNTDLIGLGLASAGFSAAGTDRENAVELFYKTQITPWASVQPDMMYIANPSGAGRDAFLIGLRTEIVF